MKLNQILNILFLISISVACTTNKNISLSSSKEYNASIQSVNETIYPKKNNQFTICVLPDIQKYTYYKTQKKHNYPISTESILLNQVDWLVNNSYINGGNIYFTIQVGDLVEEPTKKSEWTRAYNAMYKLSEVMPLAITIGNHDTDKIRKTHSFGVTKFNKFNKLFGPNSDLYKNKDWYIESYDKQNSIIKISVNDYNFLIINLELQPRSETLEWLEKKLIEYKKLPTIINIHEYLNPVITSEISIGSVGTSTDLRKGDNINSAKDLWDKVISKYDQIFMILSGHHWGESFLTQKNDNGYEVYALHADFEGNTEIINQYSEKKKKLYPSGDGWLRLMTFDIENKNIYIQTYSPSLNKEKKEINSNFIISWDWDWTNRFGG